MSVLFITKVYLWEDQRDSKNRVSPLDISKHGFREFVLNPYFITDLKTNALGSEFLYSDNIGDRRERWSRIVCDKTVAQIITYSDTAPASTAITLPIYPFNNPWGTPKFPLRDTVDTTIGWASIAYVERYNPDPAHKCWVVYDKGSFKRVEVLTNLALEDVPDLVRGGSTSTTFSTVETAFEDETTEKLKFEF
jgi:hypothetical protein